MSIYARSRTLAHSGGNALDRAVTHVASCLLARLAQLVIRTDVAGRCAYHSKEAARSRVEAGLPPYGKLWEEASEEERRRYMEESRRRVASYKD